MLRTARASFLGLSAFLAFSTARADDPTVDIMLVNTWDGNIEVRLRPDGPFDGLLSTLVFTIRWDAASDAHLAGVMQPAPVNSYIPLMKSDTETDDGGYRYQIIAGIGFQTLANIPTAWEGGVEYTVLTMHVTNGESEFAIVNDDWTAANNGDYFISLAAIDHTGNIYVDPNVGIGAATIEGLTLEVQPNPTVGATTVTIGSAHAQDIRLDLTNAAGQEVWQRLLTDIAGIRRETLDLSSLSTGVYLLRLRSGDGVLTRRLIKR